MFNNKLFVRLISISTLFTLIFTSCGSSKNNLERIEPITPVESETFNIVFKWHGGESSPEQVVYGHMPTLPSDPSSYEENGYTYTFSSWSPVVSVATEDKVYNAIYDKSESLTLYDITFNSDNGSDPIILKRKFGALVTPPYNPVKADDSEYHYSFARWDPEITRVEGNKTYTAIYKKTPIHEVSISMSCVGCSVDGRTNFYAKANIGEELNYEFALTSSAAYLYYPSSLDFYVDGVASNDYNYDSNTGKLKFTVKGNTNINAHAGDCAIELTYDYDPSNNVVTFDCDDGLSKIDWGDGTIDKTTLLKTHTYSGSANDEQYTIKIYGVFNEFNLSDSSGVLSSGNKYISNALYYRPFDRVSNYAFHQCSSLKTIGIPNGIVSIGDYAFRYCEALERVYIPKSVTSIGNQSFYNCISMKYFSFDENSQLDSIGEYSFYHCARLSSFTIPKSVTTLRNGAFSTCSFASIVIPKNVTSIGNFVFIACATLESIVVEYGNSVFDSRENCNAIVKTATNTIVCGIKTTTFPQSITSIGPNSFSSMYSLTSLSIPKTITSIDSSSFDSCSGLTSIVVDIENPVYDSRDNCNAIIETATDTLIQGCSKTVIPNSVVSLGDKCFSFTGLGSINIPDSVVSIGKYAFQGNYFLSISLPTNIKYVNNYAFTNCSVLKSVVFKSSDEEIEFSAGVFQICTKLMMFDLSLVTKIAKFGTSMFLGSTSLTEIKVPLSLENEYKAADGWKDYADIIVGV